MAHPEIPPYLVALLPLLLVAPVARGDHLPPIEDAVSLAPQTIAQGSRAELAVPALPARPGRATVLRFRAVIHTATPAGCNYNASVLVNGRALDTRAADGDQRLLGRRASLELSGQRNLGFAVAEGDRLMVMFAPDVTQGDAMTTDVLGATFLLDISDVARGVDGNTVTFVNRLPAPMDGEYGDLRVEGIEVGYLDRARLSSVTSAVPKRGPIHRSVRRVLPVVLGSGPEVVRREVTLAQSERGGFALRMADGPDILIETSLGVLPTAPSVLVADDSAPADPNVSLTVEPHGRHGFRTTAEWDGLRLSRTVSLEDDIVLWRERWTNTGETLRGVPFRNRVFLRGSAARFHVGGWDTEGVLAGSAPNPTLFIEPATDGSGPSRGPGFGIAAESDWLRLLMGLRSMDGVGELFSDTLALAPGASVDLDLSITPVAGEGYWAFINSLRRRWGVSGITQAQPLFWGCALPPGDATLDERYRAALAHLGPATVVLGPWQRLEPDARTVTADRYPRLAPDAPRAPGGCADLDVDTFLTFAHRGEFRESLREQVEAIRRVAPQVKLMQMLHPSMEAVYKPLADRWPFAADAIRTPDGAPFEDAGYSRAWLSDMTARDWGVLYYVPRFGSAYAQCVLDEARRALDALDLDGLYCDEFSWAYTTRGYSRYDYRDWDGYSVDLDDEGNVLRLKCDNAFVTEGFQLQLIHLLLDRGLFFLNNGGNSLLSVCRMPHQRFVEGGNGVSTMPQGHLSPVPLVLGNLGGETTRKGVFEDVKTCLSQGCIYSPAAVNLLVTGPDDFIPKLYPITPVELGPGWVVGEERIITTVSRTFHWRGKPGRLRILRFDADGGPLGPGPGVAIGAGKELALDVPPEGLVIAEREEGR